MNATNKRRKTNNYQASPKTVRSIDYFFGKQRIGDAKSTQREKDEDQEDGTLSDEQLARKLQAEWDEQDRTARNQNNTDPEVVIQRSESPLKPSRLSPETEQLGEAAVTEDGDAQTVQEKPGPQPVKQNGSTLFGQKNKNTLSLQSAATDEDSICQSIPFDDSPLAFDPGKYIPDLKKQWAADGGNATYGLLTRCFVLVNSTTSRIKIVDTLVNLLRTIIEGDPESLLPAVWLATNSISPPYIDLELGLGGSAISKALKKVCGLDNAALKSLYNKHGDAGDVAFEAKKKQSMTLKKPKPLTIKGAFDSLVKIANARGHGSVEVKQRIVERLVQDARGAEESRYIVRTLVQHVCINRYGSCTFLTVISSA